MTLAEMRDFLADYKGPEVHIMEVCGSHTAAISKNGIRGMLSENIHLISGPGCPVCVTPTAYVDRLIELAMTPNTCVVTFGDMLRVPGSKYSLSEVQGMGGRAIMVYSPMDIFALAEEKGEDPFIILLDNIEDPHNLGAIIRTANLAGAHGVIIPKHRAVGLTATVAKTSAGALNYTPVAKVTNLAKTMEELKDRGLWFVCADMGGESMYRLNLTGPIGLVIGNEGEGVSRLVKEKCDFIASIPMKGDIDSLNASVAAGVLAYEIVRQRLG